MRRLLILLIPLSVVAAACGSEDDPDAAHGDGHDEVGEVAEDARVVVVDARSFEFSPAQIEVDAGEELAVELTSEDVEHDFVIEELDDLHVVGVEPSDTKTGGFTAPAAGTYAFYCSVSGHRDAGMEGTLVVS